MDSYYTEYIKGSAAAISGGKLWVASNSANVVFAFSLETYVLDKLITIHENVVDELFSKIIECDKYLFLIPYNANSVWRINVDNAVLTKIEIGIKEEEKGIKGKFKTAYLWNNRLHLFGHGINACIVYDISTCHYERISYGHGNMMQFSHVMATDDRYCYLPVLNQNLMAKYDCNDSSLSCFDSQLKGIHVNFATVLQNEIVLAISNDSLVFINRDNNEMTIKKMGVIPDKYKDDESLYRRIIKHGDLTIIVPSAVGNLYYSHNDQDYKEIKLDDKSFRGKTRGFMRYEFDLLTEDKFYIQSRVDGEIYEIDLEDINIAKRMPYVPQEIVRDISANVLRIKNEPMLKEELDICLFDFIGNVIDGK